MQYNDEFLDKWELIISEVNKTDIPLECIKKVIIRLDGRKQRTVNLEMLKKQGLDINEIESAVTRTLTDLGDNVRDVDFVIDITAVAALVQPETDKLLKGIK